LVDLNVDGRDAEELGFPGKPESDQLAIYHDGEEIMVSTATPTVTRPNPPPGVEPEPEFVGRQTGAR
jgi:hypothetical protein